MDLAMPDGTILPSSEYFLSKYERRGYEVVPPMSMELTPGDEGHSCYVSTSCPLTMRSTKDDGVRYVPLTEEAAVGCLSKVPCVLGDAELQWRHGGMCRFSEGVWEMAEAGDVATVDAEGSLKSKLGDVANLRCDSRGHGMKTWARPSGCGRCYLLHVVASSSSFVERITRVPLAFVT